MTGPSIRAEALTHIASAALAQQSTRSPSAMKGKPVPQT
jgi:hypothetical protein